MGALGHLGIGAAPSGSQLPAQAPCAPSLPAMAVGCFGLGGPAGPTAGFAVEGGCSLHGSDGGDLYWRLRLLQ